MTLDEFASLLPKEIYCTDDMAGKKQRLPAKEALTRLYIQPNNAYVKRFVMVDLDRPDSFFAPEDKNYLEPTFTAINRNNGHAHVVYALRSPVNTHPNAKLVAQGLFQDVRNGITNRLQGDPCYVGLYCKNPFHPQWETHWNGLHDLTRLAEGLRKEDRKRSRNIPLGVGRNSDTFEKLRRVSYSTVWQFKKGGRSIEDFRDYLLLEAERINFENCPPLGYSEILGIAKSVAKWTWARLDPDKFSQKQRNRVLMRWNKKPTCLSKEKPWAKEGMSRASWYRRKAKPPNP